MGALIKFHKMDHSGIQRAILKSITVASNSSSQQACTGHPADKNFVPHETSPASLHWTVSWGVAWVPFIVLYVPHCEKGGLTSLSYACCYATLNRHHWTLLRRYWKHRLGFGFRIVIFAIHPLETTGERAPCAQGAHHSVFSKRNFLVGFVGCWHASNKKYILQSKEEVPLAGT